MSNVVVVVVTVWPQHPLWRRIFSVGCHSIPLVVDCVPVSRVHFVTRAGNQGFWCTAIGGSRPWLFVCLRPGNLLFSVVSISFATCVARPATFKWESLAGLLALLSSLAPRFARRKRLGAVPRSRFCGWPGGVSRSFGACCLDDWGRWWVSGPFFSCVSVRSPEVVDVVGQLRPRCCVVAGLAGLCLR